MSSSSTNSRYQIDFDGKVVLVTGIRGGLGGAIASAFADCGATLVGIDRDAAKDDVFPTFAANVSNSREVSAAFAEIESRYGSPDVLINNAGVREIKTIMDLEPDEWDRVIGINLNGVYYCAREAALRMRAKGSGNIINTASVAGTLGITHRPAYVATKHAVIGLTRNLALDLAQYKIRVNAVAPGTIRTPLTDSYFDDPEFVSDLQAVVPLGAAGTKEDVADAFVYLASPLSSFVTGTTLFVDGGWSSSKSFSYGNSKSYTSSNPSTA